MGLSVALPTPDAELFIIMAVTKQSARGTRKFRALVEKGVQGLRVGPREKMMGQRGSHVSEIFRGLSGWSKKIFSVTMKVMVKASLAGINHARTHVAATCVGQSIRFWMRRLATPENVNNLVSP